MPTDFRLDSIGQIHLSVQDLFRAVAFYCDVLGMKLLFEVPVQSMAFFDCGGIRLYLGALEDPGFCSYLVIYYWVQSIGDACAALWDCGVTFVDELHVVH